MALPTSMRRVADASFTRRPGRVCAILTADCLPVLLAAESGAGVAAAHAGWRGLAAGVIEATVGALALPPHSLLAWLGPGIGPGHFEIGAEVREELLRADPQAEAGVRAETRAADTWPISPGSPAAGSSVSASSESTAATRALTPPRSSISRIGAMGGPGGRRP